MRDATKKMAFAKYSSSFSAIQSVRPAFLRTPTPCLETRESPASVISGTPIHKLSTLVSERTLHNTYLSKDLQRLLRRNEIAKRCPKSLGNRSNLASK